MFLMGSMLVGLLAVSIPVIIHLLHRQRTTPLRWGAMQFLIETPLQKKHRKNVDHWLLMLLRMAALALLAFVLARPLWIHGAYNPLASRLPVDVAVVIDHSLSMGRQAGQQTVFDHAISATDDIARQLQPGDSISIVMAEHHPSALAPLPTSAREWPGLHDALHKLQPGLTDCSIPEAIQAARELIGRGRNVHKLIFIASDSQRTSWRPDDDSDWRLAVGLRNAGQRDLSAYELALPPADAAADISVGQISVQPSLIGAGQPVQISATVANNSPGDVGPFNLRLSVDGRAIDPPRSVPGLAAGQSLTVRFDYIFPTAGSNWIKIDADAVDSLAADDQAVAAINVWQKLPVLIIDGQLAGGQRFKSSEFLRSALQPVDAAQESATLVQPRVVSVADSASVNLDDYFVTVVNDCPILPPSLEDKLTDYVRSGHGLWLILGPRTEPGFITEDLARAGLLTATLGQPTPRGDATPQSVELKDAQNPMVSLVASDQRDAFSGALVMKWWSLQPQDLDASVVLTTGSGDPLALERPIGRNGGRLAVWSTSIDGQWNNWALMPDFVPLVNETIHHLSAAQTRGLDNRALEAGEPLIWTGPAVPEVQAVDVTLPDGSTDGNKSATLANGRFEFRYNNAFMPGLYALRFTPTEVRPQPVYYGVGIDRRELDNQPLSGKDRQKLADYLDESQPISVEDLAAIIRRENPGSELWKWLALVLLLNLLAETYVTHRLIRAQQSIDVASGSGVVAA